MKVTYSDPVPVPERTVTIECNESQANLIKTALMYFASHANFGPVPDAASTKIANTIPGDTYSYNIDNL